MVEGSGVKWWWGAATRAPSQETLKIWTFYVFIFSKMFWFYAHNRANWLPVPLFFYIQTLFYMFNLRLKYIFIFTEHYCSCYSNKYFMVLDLSFFFKVYKLKLSQEWMHKWMKLFNLSKSKQCSILKVDQIKIFREMLL